MHVVMVHAVMVIATVVGGRPRLCQIYRADLLTYVEYSDGGSGTLSQEAAIESLTIWNNWETVFGASSNRTVRVANGGAWMAGALCARNCRHT
eukprot:5047149-Pyramimonas_sp.AAC.3